MFQLVGKSSATTRMFAGEEVGLELLPVGVVVALETINLLTEKHIAGLLSGYSLDRARRFRDAPFSSS
jgi:hypothetical protein